jgi:very-short-patch-repair endonuclease
MPILMLLVLLFVVFVVWHFIPEAKPPGASPKFRHDVRVTADEPQWQSFIEEHCESPAETAFLRAMINNRNLRPNQGSLLTEGLKIDLQVQQGRYRVDFLANNWLVIEIDGAAYHSSEEAKARDRERDNYFEGLGYSVLRIPAKVVFSQPHEAVARVESALKVGKPKIVTPPPPNGFERLSKTISDFNQSMTNVRDHIAETRKINEALSSVHITFSMEKKVIESAITSANHQIKTEEYLGNSKERREIFASAKRDIEQAMLRYDAEHSRSNHRKPQSRIEIAPFSPPLIIDGEKIDASVSAAFVILARERATYMAKARQQLQSDPRLGPLVKGNLAEMGCPEVWENIS